MLHHTISPFLLLCLVMFWRCFAETSLAPEFSVQTLRSTPEEDKVDTVNPEDEEVRLYTWLPQGEGGMWNEREIKEYMSTCDIIVQIDKVEVIYDRSADTETKATRKFHVKKVLKGMVPPNAVFYDELYLEETDVVPGITTTTYLGIYYLLLKTEWVLSELKNVIYIARTETDAYVYHYFLYGKNMKRLVEQTLWFFLK